MMNVQGKQITLLQFILLIHGVQIGVGVLTLPRDLAVKAGTDGWIGIILGWFIATVTSLIIIQIMKKHPNGTILDLLSFYFGKWGGKVGGVVLGLYFALLALYSFFTEAMFIQAWVLPRASIPLLVIMLAIPSYLLVRNNIQIIGRYSVVVFFMTIWIIFFYMLSLKEAQFLNLLPLLKEGWHPVIKTVNITIITFVGFEIAFFLYPYLQKKEYASIGVVIANTITMFAYLMITLVAFVVFSPDEIAKYNEPTITILKVIELKFIERLEIVLFALYIFVMSTKVLPLMFVSVFSTSWLFGKEEHTKPLFWLLVFSVIFVILFPPSANISLTWRKELQILSYLFTYAFPICLWGYVLIHGLFKRRSIK
ncbi:endospore germination permease [Fredinandcohnia sp. QZ13]|uniref:GerAB/ArcD/ProY family transporter n=1 Tax=Fredinandcohnia sp. QZ13 TaxID=3073144 RepID=UPI0028533F14|nr:endospore germination permease [Fredinandcohnia sp. QZ13]MDR4889903.1 endospore germination permease [Fredinandcohnia sp. QZ13]